MDQKPIDQLQQHIDATQQSVLNALEIPLKIYCVSPDDPVKPLLSLLGYNSEAVSLDGIVHEHDRITFDAFVNNRQHDEIRQVECRMRDAEGLWHWYRLKQRGNIGSMEALDIWADPDDRFRDLFEHSPVGINITDANGSTIFSNRQMKVQFGFEPDDPIKVDLLLFTHPDDLGDSLEVVRDVLNSGPNVRTREKRYIRDDGSFFWALTTSRVVRDETGDVVRGYAVVQDITDLVMISQELERNERRLHQAGDLAKVGAWEIDLQQNTILLTEQTRKIFELPDDYVLTLESALSLYDEDRAQDMRSVIEGATKGQPYDIELPATTAKGNRRWVRSMGVADFEDGVAVRVRGAAQDVTEQVRIRHELEQSRWLVQQAGALSKVGGWSYDLRTGDIYWTAETRQLYGVDDNFVPDFENVLGFHDEESNPRLQAAIEGAINGTPYDIELRMTTATGRKCWVRAIGVPATENDEIIRLYGAVQDITDQIQMTQAVERNERLLQQAGELAQVGAWELDLRASSLTWTEQTRRIFEVPDDFTPTLDTALAFYHEDYLAPLQAALERAQHGEAFQEELLIKTAQGKTRWVQVIGQAAIEDGEAIRLYGAIQDITEQRKAAEALQNLIRDIDAGVLLQGPNAEMLMANEMAVRLLGLEQDDLLDRSSHSAEWLVVKEDGSPLPSADHPVPQAIATGKPVRDVVMGVYNPALAEYRWLMVSAVPRVTHDGSVEDVVCSFVDITERILAERALRESEARYRTLSANMPRSAILLYDHDLRYVLVDGPEIERTGYSKTMEGQTLREVMPAEFADFVEPLMRQTLQGASMSLEVPYEDLIYHIHYVPITDDDGKVLHGMVLAQNITEQKRAEQARAKQQQELQTIIDSLPAVVIYKDTQNRMVRANRAAAQMYGVHHPDMLIGLRPDDMNVPEAEAFYRDDREVLTTGQPKLDIIESMTLNGQTRWQRTDKVPYRDENNNITGVIAIVQDITARKAAEDALRESEARYRALVENTGLPIMYYDYHGEVLLANGAAAQLHQQAATDLVGKNLDDLFPPDIAASYIDRVRQVWTTQEPDVREDRLTVPGGAHWYLTSTYPLVNADGKTFAAQVIGQDITASKQLAEQALKVERMRMLFEQEQTLRRHKDHFLSMISHEFRNPLASIRLSNDLLRQHYDRMSVEKRDGHFAGIDEKITELNDMIEDILLLSKSEMDLIEFKPEPTPIEGFLEELLKDYAGRVRVRLGIRDRIASLDTYLLDHALGNLIHNAIKYSNDVVNLSVEQVTAGLIIRVSDKGIGIPLEDLATIFDPFKRAGNVGKIEGTGIGLAVVREFIRKHGGSVTVESKIGVGTTFEIFLPGVLWADSPEYGD